MQNKDLLLIHDIVINYIVHVIKQKFYSTCPVLSIKWRGRRLVTDTGTKCAWVIHESKAVQINVHHSNRRCLYVPRVPGSVKNPHNNNNKNQCEN